MRKTTVDVSLPIHPTLRHPRTGAPLQALGWGRRGPIWPVLGGDGTNDGGQPQGQPQGQPGAGQPQGQPQGGQQGGQQGQGGNPLDNLLDQARQNGGQQQQGQQGQPGQPQGGQQQGQQPQYATPEDVARIVESALDRRANAIHNPGGGRNRGGQQGQQGQGQGQGNGGQDGGQQQVASVDHGARREARLAFREYLGDQIRFLSDTERNVAVQMGTANIATWDGEGDADQFGRQVAQNVAAAVKDLGAMYTRVVTEQLRKQGLLKEQPQGPGAGSAPAGGLIPAMTVGGTATPLNGFAGLAPSGASPALSGALAAAQAYNQKAGYPVQGAGQTQGN
jgi:hypothetical protein